MGKIVRKIASIAMIVVGVVTGNPALILAGAQGLMAPKKPKFSAASTDRLRATIDARTSRKIVFGHTAMATDVHYQEFSGTDQEYLWTVHAVASHEVNSIDEIWFDEKKAWSATGGVTSDFSGYLTVTTRMVGTRTNAISVANGASWRSNNAYMTGIAYIVFRYKLTGNTKKVQSPFASGVTSRITTRGKGALVYDPRLDSTVAGGSGAHRADDQTTWEWDDDASRNPALQLLWYLLGWRIQNPADDSWKLVVGRGVPAARIDLESFIAAANLCDETITLDAGGTEPRYRTDGVFSEDDDPSVVFSSLLTACNGVLRDAGGRLSVDILHNDLATPVVDLTADDVTGAFSWEQTPAIDQTYNTVRGRYTDPSDASLYQLTDYPEVSIPSTDDIERSINLDLPMVQSASQAQRLGKQNLQRSQYPGTFTAEFLASAWQCTVGSVVTLTFPALGFDEKLFRVIEHSVSFDGICPMVLREEHADIYAWDEEEVAAVVAAAPISYNPLNDPLISSMLDYGLDAAWTERWPSPPPYDRPSGGLYIDQYDRIYRYEATEVLFDGEPVLIDSQPLVFGEYTEVTSDYSSTLESDNAIAIVADYQGVVITGQLPAYIKVQRTRGSTDVSDLATWGVDTIGNTATIDSEGLIEITAISETGYIDVSSSYNDVDLNKRISVIVQQQPAPVTPQVPGGGGGGSNIDTATDSTITSIFSASYGSDGAGPFIVTAGAGGQVALTAPLRYYSDPGAITYGKWQWRVIAGSWADVATEVTATTPSSSTSFFGGVTIPIPGYITINQTKTGLTAATDYEFRLLLRCTAGASGASYVGTASGTAS